MCDDTSLL